MYTHDAALGWIPQTVLLSPEGVSGSRFGVAVDVVGGVVLVGETLQGLPAMDMATGKVHVFDPLAAWARIQLLTPQDAEGGDRFGYGLAAAGGLAVIGAPGKEGGRGAAYVFERSRGPWTQAAKLVFAGDRVANDFFGYSVAIEGERILVGAIGRDGGLGAAFVFERVAGKWAQVQALKPEAGPDGETYAGHVALAGGRALVTGWGYQPVPQVGSRGEAYLYGRDEQGFVSLATLRADDGVPGDYLGIGAALSADTALLGAPYDDAPTQPAIDLSKALGSAYVFAVGQASGEPCAVDADCAGENRCCEGVCAAFSDCEATPTTGEISLTDATSAGDSSSSGGGDGSSTGTGGVPEAQLDPLASGCGCGAGGRGAPGGWLGLLLVAWRRRR